MKKIITLLILILFSLIGNSQIKTVSELESRDIIPFFNGESKQKIKKHLYIIFEKNKNSKIDSLKSSGDTILFFNLTKHIPKEKYNYGIMYDKNGKLGIFIRGSTSWGNEGKTTLTFHPKIHLKKEIKVTDRFFRNHNVLKTNDIEIIEYESLRKVIEVSDIIDILIKKSDGENNYNLYRVRNREK